MVGRRIRRMHSRAPTNIVLNYWQATRERGRWPVNTWAIPEEVEPQSELLRQRCIMACRMNCWLHPLTATRMSDKECDELREMKLTYWFDLPPGERQRVWMR